MILRSLLAAGLALCAASGGALSEQAPADFNAKWISVPGPGEKRLTVQIDPEAQRAALKAAVTPRPTVDAAMQQHETPDKAVAPDQLAWFWERISPRLSEAGPGRVPQALDVLLGRPEVPQPRLADLQKIAWENGPDILRATIGTGVSPALVLAVISVESGGQPAAVSSAGAEGLMQLIPATAARFGVKDAFSPAENISGGVQYLDWLIATFGGDPILALAGYNAGEGAVFDHAGVPPYTETRAYVPKVLAAYGVARGLCKTPPELVSDGCVFVGMDQ